MNEAFLSLGSNMGDRIWYINEAIKRLNSIPKLSIEKVSSYYETEPVGVKDYQNNYINCCVKVLTNLNAFTLLGVCLGIESSLGRERPYRYSPRTIDIDIITFNSIVLNDSNLVLPHPRAKERAFVLIPLKEICDEKTFCDLGFELNLKQCKTDGICKLK